MSIFAVFAVLITLTAIFSYINALYLKFPTAIGVMTASLASSITVIVLGLFGFGSVEWARTLVDTIDFDALLMKSMLSFLLFAGASRVNLDELKEYKWSILYLATVGMIISTFSTGVLVWWVFGIIGIDISFIYALLLGALISPIDAVAVLALLKRAGASKTLETIITGESLFNDAIAVVIFVVLLEVVADSHSISGLQIGSFFLKEAAGGLILGLFLGYVGFSMIKNLNDYVVIVLITLAIVSGGYLFANIIDISGPLTMVVAGLFLAKRSRYGSRPHPLHSEQTRDYVRHFWEVVEDVLNAVLFVLIGLEVLALKLETSYLIAGVLAIPLIILSRYISVGLPLLGLRFFRKLPSLSGVVMTWSGLRGGVSIALALSLPDSPERNHIILVTYIVVVFSILVQGMTLQRVVRWRKALD